MFCISPYIIHFILFDKTIQSGDVGPVFTHNELKTQYCLFVNRVLGLIQFEQNGWIWPFSRYSCIQSDPSPIEVFNWTLFPYWDIQLNPSSILVIIWSLLPLIYSISDDKCMEWSYILSILQEIMICAYYTKSNAKTYYHITEQIS